MKVLIIGIMVALASVPWGRSAHGDSPPSPPPARLRSVLTLPVIEILDPGGELTPKAVVEAVTRLEPALVACGAAARWEGDALAWLVTDWRGKVTKVELAVDRPAVEKCFLRALKQLAVAGAQGRATVVVRLRITNGVELPPAPTAPVPPPTR